MTRLLNDSKKFDKVVELVNEYVAMDSSTVADFVDGGDGWDNGDEDQADWLNGESAEVIADWVIAGQ